MATRSIYGPPVWRAATPATIDRRRTLAGLAVGLAGAFSGARSAAQGLKSCALTPDSGEGPFYFDAELVRVDITDDVPGAPLELAVQVVRERDCATLDGARVDLWHADAIGLYSGYERQPGTGEPSRSVVGQTFLRGTQFTDSAGHVSFRTVYPSWYGGRTPHIHFKIFLERNEVVASQIFFPEEFNNEVFEQWEPYRGRRERRSTFNSNDSFLRGSVRGVFGDVERGPGGGYLADVVIAVAA